MLGRLKYASAHCKVPKPAHKQRICHLSNNQTFSLFIFVVIFAYFVTSGSGEFKQINLDD